MKGTVAEEINNSTPEQFVCRERIRKLVCKMIQEDTTQTVELDISPYSPLYARDMIRRQILKHSYDIPKEYRERGVFSIRKVGEKFFLQYYKGGRY